jgi:hypothetical protein
MGINKKIACRAVTQKHLIMDAIKAKARGRGAKANL